MKKSGQDLKTIIAQGKKAGLQGGDALK